MRKPIIAGNWKMNKTRDEALQFIYSVSQNLPSSDVVESIIFAPSIFLRCLVKRRGDELKIGAQNVHHLDSGAYTGEISPLMIKTTGVSHVLIAHSERRSYYNETDESANLKIKASLAHGLTPMVCCGETLEEYEASKTLDILETQITTMFKDVEAEDVSNMVIAYEPVWAIGTGKTATNVEAQDSCKFIRQLIAKLYDEITASKVRILYGGSVTADNITNYLSEDDIDGFLIGGASLKSDAYLTMVNAPLNK